MKHIPLILVVVMLSALAAINTAPQKQPVYPAGHMGPAGTCWVESNPTLGTELLCNP